MKFSQIPTRSAPSAADNFVGVGADNVDFKTPISVLIPAGATLQYAGASAPAGWLLCSGQAISRTTYAGLFAAISTAFGAGDGSTTFNLPDLRGRSPVGVGTGTFAEAVTAANVNISTDQFTVSAAGGKQLMNGNPVVLTTTGTAPGGLVAATTYYVVAVDATHIRLANSTANAVNGTYIDITTQGTGTHTLTLTISARALGDRGGEEQHLTIQAEMPSHAHVFGAPTAGAGSFNGYAPSGAIANYSNINTYPTGYSGGSTGHNVLQPYLAMNYIIKT